MIILINDKIKIINNFINFFTIQIEIFYEHFNITNNLKNFNNKNKELNFQLNKENFLLKNEEGNKNSNNLILDEKFNNTDINFLDDINNNINNI